MGGVPGEYPLPFDSSEVDSPQTRTVDIEGILAIIFVLGVPSMALAVHLVVRPLIREFVGLKGDRETHRELEDRLAQLEDVVYDLDRQVNRLVEAERFRRELEAGSPQDRASSDL